MLASDQIRILQNNLHKSKERTHSILNHPDTKQYAILLLQEQYWSAYTKSSPIHHSWTLYEPTHNEQPRTAIYINNNLLSTAQVTPVPLPVSDATAIQLTIADAKPALIVNVYNPCDKSIIPELHEHLHKCINPRDYGAIIMAGDFNTHHPLWNPRAYTRHDNEADVLVNMMADLELNLLLPPGTVTFPSAGTTIDLVWGNNEAANRIIKCRITEQNDHGSDHLPIETEIAICTERPQYPPAYNFAKTNWKELNEKLKCYLPSPISVKETTTCSEVDNCADQLVTAITKAIEETTPRKKPSPHSKRWWNEQLTTLRREANRLRNTYRRTKHEADKMVWRAKANEYIWEIRRAKTNKWKEYVDNADGKTIWQIQKYATSTMTTTHVPTLNEKAATNEQKVNALRKAFFPKPPLADLTDIP